MDLIENFEHIAALCARRDPPWGEVLHQYTQGLYHDIDPKRRALELAPILQSGDHGGLRIHMKLTNHKENVGRVFSGVMVVDHLEMLEAVLPYVVSVDIHGAQHPRHAGSLEWIFKHSTNLESIRAASMAVIRGPLMQARKVYPRLEALNVGIPSSQHIEGVEMPKLKHYGTGSTLTDPFSANRHSLGPVLDKMYSNLRSTTLRLPPIHDRVRLPTYIEDMTSGERNVTVVLRVNGELRVYGVHRLIDELSELPDVCKDSVVIAPDRWSTELQKSKLPRFGRDRGITLFAPREDLQGPTLTSTYAQYIAHVEQRDQERPAHTVPWAMDWRF